MSKELVVSSNRHETRLAILEDDQLVEIHFQRQQEYSLAGSIHKGRVTRVLPGMQSAFVDIGLDRDAFLYVSDFFEDNDEYEQVVGAVEDQVLRLEKGGTPRVAAPEPEAPAARVEAPRIVAELATPIAPAGERPTLLPAGQDRDGRDRRGGGRRPRRRRGRGRGFPDSKYASPNAVGESTPEVREAPELTGAEPDREEEDLPVLPGESISKYRGVEPGNEPEPEAGQENDVSETELGPAAGAAIEANRFTWQPDVIEATQHAVDVAPEPLPEPVKEPIPEPEPVYREPEPTPVKEPEPEPLHPVSEELSASGAPSFTEPVAESTPEDVPEAEDLDEEEPSAAMGEESVEDSFEGVEAGPAEASVAEGVEPARIPTSLTAQLREQGGRYPHRASRRTRRRPRGDGRPDGRPDGQSGGGRPDGPRENRTEPLETSPEQRVAPRQERQERQERGDRPQQQERTERPQPSISDLLREGQEIIVQISKEPLGQKGARITSYVALPGRFVVYMPTVDHVGVSRKIGSDEERLRLKRILQKNREGIPGGFILRTAGEGRSEEELRADMHFLYNLWMDMRQKAEKKKAPALVHHDLDLVQRILRDQLTSSFKNVWVDNEEMYEEVVSFVQRFQPGMVSRVKLYTRPAPIFDAFNITSELEKALKPKVWLKTGGYIVINQTEALVAIDINTGKYVGKSNRLEDTIVKTNTDAVKEIVRQIRLRDLGGIIIVDFIDMDERRNRQKVMQALEEAMAADRAPNKILAFNDFGLVAITRKRVKQSLERTMCSPCPYCEGAGYVKSVATVIGEILTEAGKIARAVEGQKDVELRVNPEVAKVLKSHNNDHLTELEEILGRTVIVKSDPTLHQEKFDLA